MQAQFRTAPRIPATAPQALRTTVSTRTMNTQPVTARMPPMTPSVLAVTASSAASGAALSARPQPYKYTATMRNPPQTVSAVQQQVVQQPAVHVQGQEPLTATMLASADVTEQKQMLGERLFPLIQVSAVFHRIDITDS